MKTRGTAVVEVVGVIALIGGLIFGFKPEWLPGTAAYRAKKAKQATEQVQQATTRVDDAVRRQGEEVAAGLTAIGKANDAAPASPSKDFISMEVPYLLGVSPFKPTAQALLAAEQRRAAVMEGERDEARRLYAEAYGRADKLQRELEAARLALQRANAERERIDQQYAEIAAAEHARTMQAIGLGVVALLFLGGWVYTRIYSIGPQTLGRIAADVRAGTPPIQALDTYLAPRLHSQVRKHAKLATEPS